MDRIVAFVAACSLLLTFGEIARAADEDPNLIGMGWRVRPTYEGAASDKGEWMPVIRVRGDTWFVRTTHGKLEGGGGFWTVGGLELGGQLAYEDGRLASESAFLRSRGVPNLDAGPSIGLYAEYDWKVGTTLINALARYRCRWHFDGDRGAQADFRLTTRVLDKGGFAAAVFAQLTLADRQEMRGYSGVSQALSASSGLAQYDPEAGPRFVAVGVQAAYHIGRHLTLVGSAELHRMVGDAAASPLVERKTNAYLGVGIALRR